MRPVHVFAASFVSHPLSTPMDISKINEAMALIGLPLEEVRRRAPQVKYVVARLVAPNESENPVLFHQLFSTQGPRPPGVETLVEVSATQADGHAEKFLGVYRIASSTSGAGEVRR